MSSIFLSHTSVDKPFVEKLAKDLKRIGVEVWYDKWQISVGESITWKIESGIRENEYLGIILSSEALQSEWVKSELSAAWVKQMKSRKVFILPILYRECDIPLLLADKKYADFRSSYDDGLQTLARVFGIKDTDTVSIENWRLFTNKRDVDWKKYKVMEFESLVTTLVDRAIEYNWSSYVGGTANPFSIQLHAGISEPQGTFGNQVVHKYISKYVTFKLKPHTNSYWTTAKEEYNPNHFKSGDFDIYVGNTINACDEYLWRAMEDFKDQYGNPKEKPVHFINKFTKSDDWTEAARGFMKKLHWYKGNKLF